jgi:hypothetical protein
MCAEYINRLMLTEDVKTKKRGKEVKKKEQDGRLKGRTKKRKKEYTENTKN